MDFTREPIIETIVTPKEGHKLVIRNSKNAGQEEHFVEAVEVVAFGRAHFFRSLERPKAFLLPVSDYEVLEVREARMVLKNAGLDRSIKIGGGRDGNLKSSKEHDKIDHASDDKRDERKDEAAKTEGSGSSSESKTEVRVDKKRDRRRHYRKRKGKEEKDELSKTEESSFAGTEDEGDHVRLPPPDPEAIEGEEKATSLSPVVLSSLLQPPPTLISETINRYRQNDLFKSAFYLTEEDEYKPHDKVQDLLNEEDDEEMVPHLEEPVFEGAEADESAQSAIDHAMDSGFIEKTDEELQEDGASSWMENHEEENSPQKWEEKSEQIGQREEKEQEKSTQEEEFSSAEVSHQEMSLPALEEPLEHPQDDAQMQNEIDIYTTSQRDVEDEMPHPHEEKPEDDHTKKHEE